MDTYLTESLAAELRLQMARARLTGKDLAHNLGVSPVTISRYLNGDRDMPASLLVRALLTMDVAVGAFFESVTDRESKRLVEELIAGLTDPHSEHVALPDGIAIDAGAIGIYDTRTKAYEPLTPTLGRVTLSRDGLIAFRLCPDCGRGIVLTAGSLGT